MPGAIVNPCLKALNSSACVCRRTNRSSDTSGLPLKNCCRVISFLVAGEAALMPGVGIEPLLAAIAKGLLSGATDFVLLRGGAILIYSCN